MTTKPDEANMPPFPGRAITFGTFNVTSQASRSQTTLPPTRLANADDQVFHLTPHTFALVNLKPLLPGHILVCPLRVQPRLADLTTTEISDLFLTVTRVQRTLSRLYAASAFNVAVQDGEAAGQSVKHVHVHVIPRAEGDPGGGDKVHQWLEGEEGRVGEHLGRGEAGDRRGQWAKDEERVARGREEMEEEARWLRAEMERDAKEEGEGKL